LDLPLEDGGNTYVDNDSDSSCEFDIGVENAGYQKARRAEEEEEDSFDR